MSFDIALSGLNAIGTKLDSISNNVANSSTEGYKRMDANFASLMAGNRPNGVYVGSASQNISGQGGLNSTGNKMHSSIMGQGFYAMRAPDGTMQYTRVGRFEKAEDGYIIDTFGRRVQGYGIDGALGDLKVQTGDIAAVATDRYDFTMNMSAEWEAVDIEDPGFDPVNDSHHSNSQTVYDALGREHTLTQYFVKSSDKPHEVTVYYALDGDLIENAGENVTSTLAFDDDGTLNTGSSNFATLDIELVGTNNLNIKMDYAGSTMFGGLDPLATTDRPNGNSAGTFVEVVLDKNGDLVASYSNGKRETVGTVALATFGNANGLQQIDNTSWTQTAGSGNPLFGRPGQGRGELQVGFIEGSNVDITTELVVLMGAQRDYQANSKVISTSNEMMRALMQAV
ncbi:flagellar hook-basal body complex protein [Chromobacterium amazonense]|uniref:flagellar hook protein FlgE n=1 Tax=Chromobacterium amazonense TaxID=1382803 RepID=UPI0031F65279